MGVKVDKRCTSCGAKLEQYVSFSETNGRLTIKVYRYKCPHCGALLTRPTVEEIRRAVTLTS